MCVAGIYTGFLVAPLKTHAISSMLYHLDVKTHAYSNQRLARGRRRGEEEEEEWRRVGGEEGRLAAIHTGFKGYHKCVVAIYTGF